MRTWFIAWSITHPIPAALFYTVALTCIFTSAATWFVTGHIAGVIFLLIGAACIFVLCYAFFMITATAHGLIDLVQDYKKLLSELGFNVDLDRRMP